MISEVCPYCGFEIKDDEYSILDGDGILAHEACVEQAEEEAE